MSSKLTKKQQYWFAHLDAQRQSGLSQKAYCQEHSLSYVQMGYYSGLALRNNKKKTKSNNFVRLSAASRQDKVKSVSVHFACGATLECPTSDPALLQDIVRALK